MNFNNFTLTNERQPADFFSVYFFSIYSSKRIHLQTSTLNICTFDFPNNVILLIGDVYRYLLAWGVCGLLVLMALPITAYMNLDQSWLFLSEIYSDVRYMRIFSHLYSSSITSILKSGNQAIISNYRSVSIQSHISKIFKSFVLDTISLLINYVLVKEQHSFRPRRSTTICKLMFSICVYDFFLNNSQVYVIYLNFKKSFWFYEP